MSFTGINSYKHFIRRPRLLANFLLCQSNMKKAISIFIKLSAIYLWCIGVIFILKDAIYPDFKLGPIPWWVVTFLILISVIPAIALFLIPNSEGYKRIYKILFSILLAPPLLIFSVNTYDCLLCIYQDRYREGIFYISSLSLGTAACLLGYFVLILNSLSKRKT